MSWIDLDAELAELFAEERLEWSPDSVSVFQRALPSPAAGRPREVAPTRRTWIGAALLLSGAGKIDFRAEALRLVASGVSIRSTAKWLGLDDKTVRRWIQRAREEAKEAA
jgi:hypothetical protein